MKAATHTLDAKQKTCYKVLIIAPKLQGRCYSVNSPSKHHRIYGYLKKKNANGKREMQGIIEPELASKRSISQVLIFSFLCCSFLASVLIHFGLQENLCPELLR